MKHEMSLIRKLEVLYEERFREIYDLDLWHDEITKAWPKVLSLVKACMKEQEPLPPCTSIDGHGSSAFCDCPQVWAERRERLTAKLNALHALERA